MCIVVENWLRGDLKSSAERLAGSSPASGTTLPTAPASGGLGPQPRFQTRATSAFGTSCDAVTDGEPRLKLACSEKTEDIDGFEQEEEVEVELELEEIEEEDEEE